MDDDDEDKDTDEEEEVEEEDIPDDETPEEVKDVKSGCFFKKFLSQNLLLGDIILFNSKGFNMRRHLYTPFPILNVRTNVSTMCFTGWADAMAKVPRTNSGKFVLECFQLQLEGFFISL